MSNYYFDPVYGYPYLKLNPQITLIYDNWCKIPYNLDVTNPDDLSLLIRDTMINNNFTMVRLYSTDNTLDYEYEIRKCNPIEDILTFINDIYSDTENEYEQMYIYHHEAEYDDYFYNNPKYHFYENFSDVYIGEYDSITEFTEEYINEYILSCYNVDETVEDLIQFVDTEAYYRCRLEDDTYNFETYRRRFRYKQISKGW